MNLLNQKLKEKFKHFEEIDRELSENINTKKSGKTSRNNIKNNKEEIFSEQFDIIYSNFKIGTKQNYRTTNKTNSKKGNTLHQRTKSKSSLTSRSNSKEISNSSNIITKSSKNITPPNESGDRLYNYGFYIKNKLERKRKEELKKISRQMTPKILQRSKNIYRDNHFEDRLYYKSSNSPIPTKK